MGALWGHFLLFLFQKLQIIFNFGRYLVKEGNGGYCQCPQLASSISEKSAYVVGAGAPIYCLSNVSLEFCLPVDVLCDRRRPLSKAEPGCCITPVLSLASVRQAWFWRISPVQGFKSTSGSALWGSLLLSARSASRWQCRVA